MRVKNSAGHAKYEKQTVAKTVGEARELVGRTRRLFGLGLRTCLLKMPRFGKQQEPLPLEDMKADHEEAAGGRRRAGCKASACKHARSDQRPPLQHPGSRHSRSLARWTRAPQRRHLEAAFVTTALF